MALSDRLTTELSAISKEYDEHFAGQSRISRDLGLLDKLIGRLRSVASEAEQIPAAARGKDLAAIAEEVERSLAVYEAEKRAIEQAKAAGPEFEPFGALATKANFIFARYGRHFAGQSRNTRDALLLEEMVEELKKIHEEMVALAGDPPRDPFAGDVALVAQNTQMYKQEALAISEAQTTGTHEERANLLATLANNQFSVYRDHFAGASRATRRPALLVRLIDSLEIIEDRMVRIAQSGYNVDFHAKNLEIVRAQLQLYRAELDEIRAARRGTKMADLMGMLGGAANELFEEYRTTFGGKDRRKVDRAKLGLICDKLHEIARQMEDLGRAEASEMNDQNLGIVQEQLSHFEHEFEEVSAAQANRGQGPGAGR